MPNFIPKKKSGDKPKRRKRTERQTWIDKVDKVFSQYIRMRDSKMYGFRYFRCPTCHRILPISQADCSHYYSRAFMGTRFDPDNCMAECAYDNRYNSSHLIEMGKTLEKTIGTEAYLQLKAKARATCKLSAEDLKEKYMYFAALVLKMKEEEKNNLIKGRF